MIGRTTSLLYALADYIGAPGPLSPEASFRVAAALRTAADEAARMEQALDEIVGEARAASTHAQKVGRAA